jgi:hypothetical protein
MPCVVQESQPLLQGEQDGVPRLPDGQPTYETAGLPAPEPPPAAEKEAAPEGSKLQETAPEAEKLQEAATESSKQEVGPEVLILRETAPEEARAHNSAALADEEITKAPDAASEALKGSDSISPGAVTDDCEGAAQRDSVAASGGGNASANAGPNVAEVLCPSAPTGGASSAEVAVLRSEVASLRGQLAELQRAFERQPADFGEIEPCVAHEIGLGGAQPRRSSLQVPGGLNPGPTRRSGSITNSESASGVVTPSKSEPFGCGTSSLPATGTVEVQTHLWLTSPTASPIKIALWLDAKGGVCSFWAKAEPNLEGGS